MIAPVKLPSAYQVWNNKWGAPLGRSGYRRWPLAETQIDIRKRGPFAFQENNSTREFEYPWAYAEIIKHGSTGVVIDVGGSLGGMQYVLGAEGYEVTNIDPGLEADGLGWGLNANMHARLSKCFSAPVKLVNSAIQNANLPHESADVVMCISALEHFSEMDAAAAATHFARVLKPSGIAVLTVDLFLDLKPFTDRPENEFGRNLDIYRWLELSGLELIAGNPKELFGFPEFSSNSILRELSRYHVGKFYPALAQCVVARKRP